MRAEVTAKHDPPQALLGWYDRVKRDLPWRRTTDPYRILVSEVMLQQTQVKTVLGYYEAFLQRFPDVHTLAAASEDDVLTAWKGLGYYRRARNLHASAKLIVAEHGGQVPNTYAELRQLKGIGDYTAAAVASIAFGEAKGVVDGNVLRVMARFFGIEQAIDDAKVKRTIQEAVDEMIPPDRPGDFNQALMELGATVCTPHAPDCDACPLRAECLARAKGLCAKLPVRRRREKVSLSRRVVGVLERSGQILLMRRPAEGLLGGMWEFLNLEAEEGERLTAESLIERVPALTGDEVLSHAHVGEVVHRFSHLEWQIDVYIIRLKAGGVRERTLTDGLEWVEKERVQEYALPRVMQKVWERVVSGSES